MSLRICAVSPEPPLLAHTSSESRGTFRQKARSLAPLNGWACAVKICHDGMLEDTNSLDGAYFIFWCIFHHHRVTSVYRTVYWRKHIFVNTPQSLCNTFVGVQANFRVSYPNCVMSRAKCMDYIRNYKRILSSYLGSNSDPCSLSMLYPKPCYNKLSYKEVQV